MSDSNFHSLNLHIHSHRKDKYDQSEKAAEKPPKDLGDVELVDSFETRPRSLNSEIGCKRYGQNSEVMQAEKDRSGPSGFYPETPAIRTLRVKSGHSGKPPDAYWKSRSVTRNSPGPSGYPDPPAVTRTLRESPKTVLENPE
jgi:hypothetical protein